MSGISFFNFMLHLQKQLLFPLAKDSASWTTKQQLKTKQQLLALLDQVTK